MSNAHMTQIAFHEVEASDIKVEMTDHNWFATLSINIGKMQITLFTKDKAEAHNIVDALSVVKHTKAYADNSADWNYVDEDEPF